MVREYKIPLVELVDNVFQVDFPELAAITERLEAIVEETADFHLKMLELLEKRLTQIAQNVRR
tara:strand:- start:627 stop:815 length:189 start_codon:yes stop_codon:yes gene_type:complete